MKKICSLAVISISAIVLSSATFTNTNIEWKKIDDGLHYGTYVSPKKSTLGDQTFDILKISPEHYNFNLHSAKENGEETRTAEQWAADKKQIAVINAGMYMRDHKTNLGYMKNYDFVNNPRINKDNTIVAFNRKNDSLPEFQIIDRQCQDWDTLKDQYHSFTQSIRMMDCNQRNKWSQQNKKWSMVVIGKDTQGNALFIFARSPYTVHDFIDILSDAPLDLYNLMYLEGGPEASFYINHNGTEVKKNGEL